MRIEQSIINNLVYDEDYCRKVVPFLKPTYFTEHKERIIVTAILEFFSQFNKPLSKEILSIEVSNRSDLTEQHHKDIQDSILTIENNETNKDWLLEQSEKFCKDRAVYLAIMDSIKIIEGRDKVQNKDSIPSILSDALAVSFDNHIGHDYIDDADDRWAYYHRLEEKIPFDIDLLNKITKGGLSKKTLNVILAGTGVGKSLFMCHVAAACLTQNLNVLYITLEMAEERIAERIDCNLLNITMDELKTIDKDIFDNRLAKLASKTQGKLIVKEYPTSTAHAGHFRALIEELKMKRDFKPDLVVVDYLNICSSQRLKYGANVNSYTYVKSIAEELRGLAVEYNLPILSATQTTRSGFTNSDPGLEDTSESFGLPATVDLMVALVATEEMDEMNQIMVKQLKNRYSDPSYYKRFVVGIDRSKMKIYNVEVSAQTGISDSGKPDEDIPLFDKSKIGRRSSIDSSGFNFT
jgi:replicative DNA helicase